MTTQLIYLARPIDLVGDDSYIDWVVDRVRHAMGTHDLVAYNPAGAFIVPDRTRPDGSISWINRAALSRCRGVVILFPERPSIGVGMELQMAQELGLPTLVLTTLLSDGSWSLAGLKSAEVLQVPMAKNVWASTDVQALERSLDELRRNCLAVDRFPRNDLEPLRVQLDDDSCSMMTRSYRGDAGFDLYTSEEVEVGPGEFVDIPCGISVQLPRGVWGMIVGRSSTLRRHRLLVMPGVIDQGYRGPLFAGVTNLGTEPFQAKVGSRLAQFIPLPLVADRLLQVRAERLEGSDRGRSGFGSSGE